MEVLALGKKDANMAPTQIASLPGVKWRSLPHTADMLVARKEFVSATVKNFIYVAAGYGNNERLRSAQVRFHDYRALLDFSTYFHFLFYD
jgi:hypothetical protein